MRLTDEQIKKKKKLFKGETSRFEDDLIDTTKALQQENEQLRREIGEWKYETQCHMDIVTEKCKEVEGLQGKLRDLDGEVEQLQAQNGAMRQQLEIIKANIHEFPPEGMTIGKQIWIETTNAALSTTPATCHNLADVEVLEKAREAIKHLSLCDCNYNCEDCPIDNKLCSIYADGTIIDDVLAAIAEVGANEI